MTHIEDYYKKISTGEIVANEKIKAVYKRLVQDMKKPRKVSYFNEISGEEETRVYIYDEEKSQRAIYFLENFCRHSKGKWAGQKIKLELWQKALVSAMYGFVDKETGLRKYKKVVLFIGRKNGKTTLAAGLGNYALTSDGEYGAEVYSVATKKDQANNLWEEARRMIKKSEVLSKRVKIKVNGLFYEARDGFFKALASDSNSLDGLNASFVAADETHAWKDKNLMDVMFDSMSAREQPLLFETSTMGTVRESVFDNEYDYCENLIKGYLGEDGGFMDETVLPIIYELDNIAEWVDESCWVKANPGLGTIKNIDDLRAKVNRAQNNPAEISNLLCKDFNIRVTGNEKWLTYETINNTDTFEMIEMSDTYAVGGADLSSTTDLTCATIIVCKNKKKYVLQQYFIPEANIDLKIKEDKIPYKIWESRGLVTLCEGAKVNYTDVTNWFIKMYNDYDINTLWVGYDPWNTQYWVDEMKEAGFEMIEIRQGAKTMSAPMKLLQADLEEKTLNYNNNPVLKWCLSNTSVKRDENDNIRPVKGRQQRARIDGAVSLIIAYCVLQQRLNDYLSLVEE